ncbi:odorant receptor 13a-like isoform X1 [Fopius arisanus]|uniref:Odorant receptor n=2 Tax=Fopius arisanus TaxID=64838 RepID=A0A9R1TIB3_9HYME|nr:PREDICTED: odorant receptor 13a-like isoform X1 [Fopius arisanus]
MKGDNIFSDGYYKANRILMIIIGIWPESSLSEKIIVRIVMSIILLSMLIPQYVYLFRKCDTLDDMIFGLIAQVSVAIGFTKYYFMVSNMKQIRMAIDQVRQDWRMFDDSPAIETIHNYAARGSLATKCYIIIFCAAYLIFSVVPLKQVILDALIPLNESRPKIFIFDVDYSIYGIDALEYYYPTLIHSCFSSMIVLHMIVTVDTFVLVMVEHCCGLFETIGGILKETELEKSGVRQFKIICRAVVVHHRAISLAEFIESSFNMMYAFVVLASMVLISSTGLEAIIKMDEVAEMTRFLTFTVGQLFHLLFISLPGQELLDHSTRVSEQVYSCDWSRISADGRKLISIMLMRSMKPLRMTAGRFYLMNIENYGNVLRTSFSYFTVMLSTR